MALNPAMGGEGRSSSFVVVEGEKDGKCLAEKALQCSRAVEYRYSSQDVMLS